MSKKIVIHKEIALGLNDLYSKKNADYGDSFSMLRNKYSNAILIRLWDKLNRLDSLMTPGKEQQVNDESIEDTLLDLANYCMMEVTERRFERMVENE